MNENIESEKKLVTIEISLIEVNCKLLFCIFPYEITYNKINLK